MNIEKYLKDFEKNFNGDRSIIVDHLGTRLDFYEDKELPFKYEFIYFEERYVQIYKHIKELKLPFKKITDIGCQLGVQSELFKNEFEYTGIECEKQRFFNSDDSRCKFKNATFPFVKIAWEDNIIISCMSLGYFNSYISNDENLAYQLIVEKLKKAKFLYIVSNEKLINMLSEHFYLEHLDKKPPTEVSNNLYFMWNKEIKNGTKI